MKFKIDLFLKILIAYLLAVCTCKPYSVSFEWEKLETEPELFYKYIFDIIQFKTEICQLNFYNCVFDVENKDIDDTIISTNKCFPPQKSRYCLQQKHYESDCPFQLISKQMDKYKARLGKEIESCVQWFSRKTNGVNKATHDNQQSNSSKSINFLQILLIVGVICVIVSLILVCVYKTKTLKCGYQLQNASIKN
jgi:hypothetical protein